ncbi:hypothetical protein C7999DRAFT_42776 [Corynascus novoguineensis]|uniref:DNA 3'-5' helicase n=1 Tax=Corynascus novoguineensis TaxID=1126955 RepID=A0AAN7HLD6_9PEZI|nr:hypothetical protein C7999DRAFT_42776 [Corynascus novoguineensis]
MSRAQDRHDSYYEAGLPSSPAFEPNLLMTPMESKEVRAGRFHSLESSSPTGRVSTLKQRNVLVSHDRMPAPHLDAFPQDLSRISNKTHPHSTTPVVHGIPLVSLRQILPDQFRTIFPYELFNAVQSKCFDVVYRTKDNVVVAAPTGSGKTAILELAICKLALDRGRENFKIVYQAPTKALCSERARDWGGKFGHMNLKCAELTGDTSPAEMRRVGDASIIVTTPEKWDSITRKWRDHRRLLQMVELFLIDEVHILKDVRGATLETVVSRMKTIGASVRFIALSATVPNSEDIAKWLGRNHTNQQLPAHREAFGEDFRPVKLRKYVYGFDGSGNDFTFDRFLDQKLPGLISRHAEQKPILIFCFTRKSCETTAAMLADFAAGRPVGDKLWPVPSQRIPVVSRDLQEIVGFGVAFHYAGLDAQDRVAVEQGFLNGQLGVICCTSTLAVGINLPCHTVVLKGTAGFMNDKLEEYSDLEVMQMLGRAGRPQFDDSATAIILTRATKKERYEKMVSGQEILESTLHLNLIEHLNSEICLGTIHDLTSAKRWLGGTFLSVRLRRNPSHYHLAGEATNPSQIDDKLEEICERDIKQLQEADLYGCAMSKYMVEFQTMKLLLQIPRGAGMETLEAVTQTRHKVSLVVQAHLGCVQFPDSDDATKLRRQFMIERKLVFERLNRLVRAVIDCKGYDRDSVGTKTALELARGLAAESWEGRATQLTQIPNIGPVGMRKLASKDIHTVLQLADRHHDEIERLMSRQPPFGKNLQAQLDKFPRLHVEAAVVGHKVQPRCDEPVLIEVKATLRYLNRTGPPNWLGRVPVLTFLTETCSGVLVYFWRGSVKKLDKQRGLELKFWVGICDVNKHITCHFSCEEIVGTMVSTTVRHNVAASVFPSRRVAGKKNPSQQKEKESQEYLDNDGIDDLDLILVAEQAVDLIGPRHSQKKDTFNNNLVRRGEGDDDSSQMANTQPLQLPNGKWRCNHPCSGDAPTKSGKPCSHRCCREGLERPRKLGLQWQNKKRQLSPGDGPGETKMWQSAGAHPRQQPQGITHASAIPRPKRQRVQETPSIVLSALASPFKSAVEGSNNDWNKADLDEMDVDCIDLSWVDDDDEISGLVTSGSRQEEANRPLIEATRADAVTLYAHESGPSKPVTRALAQTDIRTVARAASRDDHDVDEYSVDQDYSPEPDKHLDGDHTMMQPTTGAFKSGASDEVLYQGITNKFHKTTSSFQRSDSHEDTLKISSGTTKPGEQSLPVPVEFPELTSDQSPGSLVAGEPTISPVNSGGRTNTSGGPKRRTATTSNEPDWVAEFDPEIIDMFRGYVTFV